MLPISTGIGPMFTCTGTWQTTAESVSQFATGGDGAGAGSCATAGAVAPMIGAAASAQTITARLMTTALAAWS